MSEQDFISFPCPNCSAIVDFVGDLAGTAQVCPFCNAEIVVPASKDEGPRALSLPLETERLTIRRLEKDDLFDVTEILSDPDIFQYEQEEPQDETGSKRWLEWALGLMPTELHGGIVLGLVHQEDHRLIGQVTLLYTDAVRQQAGFKIQIHRDYQRKGLGLEALRAFLKFCFSDLGLHRVTASCDARNTGATRLLEKAGLRREAQFRKDHPVDDAWGDSVWYAMLEEEFPAQ